MCCLFGLLDYNNRFTPKQRQIILHALATECEERGTDATGISYMSEGRMRIYKRAVRGRYMWFRLPQDASYIMGHTRLTTQGNARHNYNNHPFSGRCGSGSFTLAHNGVLWNDVQLRKQRNLPKTNIETDSYIAVQLLEREAAINLASIKKMAEAVEGQFTFTVLDNHNNLFFVKGHNPLSLYHFNDGFYLYASTDTIMERVLEKLPFSTTDYHKLTVQDGQILQIDTAGKCKVGDFKLEEHYSYGWGYSSYWKRGQAIQRKQSMSDIITTANNMGYSVEDIIELLDSGYYEEDIEDLLYDPELMAMCMQEIGHERLLAAAMG